MIQYGPCMILYGPIWSRKVPYGPLWSPLVLFGTLWSSMVLYGPPRSRMVIYGPLWSSTVPYDSLWFPMVSHGPLWSPMVPYSEGRESRSRLGLVQNFGTGLVSVSSRMKNFEIVSSRSRLVCFHFTQSRPDRDV